MWVLLGGWWRRRGRERPRGGREVGQHAAVERLQAALLGGCQVRGQREGAHLGERLPEALEALLEVDGAWRQRRCGRGRAGHAERVTRQRGAIARVGHAVGVHQRERLTGAQVVARHGGEHGVLVVALEGAQGVRQRRADGPLRELVLRRRRQVRPEQEPPRHPRGLATEQARHAARR
jgi:hypothetical protein